MKKSNLIKLFSILLMSIMVIMFTTNVWAEDNDFTTLPVNTNNTANTNSNNTNANTNNSNTPSNNSNTNRSNTNTANTNSNNTNNTNNANNSSIYNNTNLQKTGIEDSIPVAMLVVIFGISAIYAYKKIRDYRNI